MLWQSSTQVEDDSTASTPKTSADLSDRSDASSVSSGGGVSQYASGVSADLDGQLARLFQDLPAEEKIELICVPGFGGSRLLKPDESGHDVEVYPALWQCIKGFGKPSERMIRVEGDGSYASEVLCRIAHISQWVPFVELQKSGEVETHMWPYDWRRDVNELGPSLLDWLLHLKTRRPPKTRFIILAHSYGGLVTVDALSKLEDIDLIKGVITFGSPFQGTYKVQGVRRDGFKIMKYLQVYTPATYQSFDALWFMTPGSEQLATWRRQVVERNSLALEATPFVCISGEADTLNAELEGIMEESAPSSTALGDGTVTVESATTPPGVKHIHKIVSQNQHILLANCEESIEAALRIILETSLPDSEAEDAESKRTSNYATSGVWTVRSNLSRLLNALRSEDA